MRGIAIAAGLAVRDFFYDRLMTLCAVLSLASILAPLLILAGVRYGVISVLRERLMRDPSILIVRPEGSRGGYSREWIDSLATRPDVAFVVARTRDIAAVMPLAKAGEAAGHDVAADMEPTAAGDPLLTKYHIAVPDGDRAVVSASVARKLGVGPGDGIDGHLGRRRGLGGLESVTVPLTVTAVLPCRRTAATSFSCPCRCWRTRSAIATVLPCRPGASPAIPPPDGPAMYGGFRLYAKDLASVSSVRDYLTAQGVEVVTRAREIEAVRGLDRALTLVFALIAVSAGAGFVASSASSVLAAVRRKDKHLAMIRLLGFSGMAIRAFPVIQAVLTAVLGSLLAWGIYAAIAACIDRLFSQALYGEAVCRLPAGHLAAAFGIVVLLSFLSSLQASFRAARIDPSEVLREL